MKQVSGTLVFSHSECSFCCSLEAAVEIEKGEEVMGCEARRGH